MSPSPLARSLVSLLLLTAATAPALADEPLPPEGEEDEEAPPATRFQIGAGGGFAIIPYGEGGATLNGELLFAWRGPSLDVRFGPMVISGKVDGTQVVGLYGRFEMLLHLGHRYSLGLGSAFGTMRTQDEEGMVESHVTVGPSVAPVVYRLGARRQHELALWIGSQRELSTDFVTPVTFLSFDSYF